MTLRLVLLIALIAAIALLARSRLTGGDAAPPLPETARPGYYLTGVDLEEYGSDGMLRIGLQSATAQEDPTSGMVTLAEVTVDYHAVDGQRWHLTAAEARVPQASEVVDFQGDVRLTGKPAGYTETAELRTDRMSLDTDSERARTDGRVELAFGRHLMQAQGMDADLKAGQIRLESDVSGTFAP